MDLFSPPQELITNLLPAEGDVRYYGPILSNAKATEFLHLLLANVPWRQDEAVHFGKHIRTRRKVAWYGDQEYAYTYSNSTKFALPWSPELLEIRSLIQEKLDTHFNSCLLNLYHDGDDGMAWHSDHEKSLGRNTTIASLSFGAERTFSLRHKVSKQLVSLPLAHGSLLVMQGETQTYWQHALPKSKKVRHPRINLTFRTIIHES